MDRLGKRACLWIAVFAGICSGILAQELPVVQAHLVEETERQLSDSLLSLKDSRPLDLKEVGFSYLHKARKNGFLYLECQSQNVVGRSYRQLGNTDSALYYHTEALKQAVSLRSGFLIGCSQMGIGLAYRLKGEFPLAVKHLNMAHTKFKEEVETGYEAEVLNHLGNLYRTLGNYIKAISLHEEALGIRQAHQLQNDAGNSYHNLGVVYSEQGNPLKAIEYFQQAIDIRRYFGRVNLLSRSFIKLSESLFAIGETEDAILAADSALQLAYFWGEPQLLITAQANRGKILFTAGFPEKATVQLDSALQFLLRQDMTEHNLANYLALGNTFLEFGNAATGLELTQKAASTADLTGAYRVEGQAIEAIIKYYERSGNMDSIKVYKERLDLIEKEINLASIEVYRKELEAEQQIQEIPDEQRQILEEAKAALTRDLDMRYTGIYGILVTILVLTIGGALWILWFRYRDQRRLNKLLHLQKQEIERQNQELARSNKELARFTHVVSHDLKQPLRTIGAFSSLIERRYNDLLDTSGKAYLHYIIQGVGHMHQLLSDLLLYAQIGQVRMEKQDLDLNEVLDQVLWNLQREIAESNGQIQAEKLPKVFGNRVSLIQLFQNLISNALKFKADRPSLIRITCKEKSNLWQISVSDNGIGIGPDDRQLVFELFHRTHSEEEYPGTGIGLSICQKVVQQHGGQIWVESEVGIGSTFQISLPKFRMEDRPKAESTKEAQPATF